MSEQWNSLDLAGLLMFGRAEVIRDALPHYMVDYQERREAKAEKRWIDRLIPDGSWSGNVYDFFRKVYQKLTADLKVPFQLWEGQRIDDTPVHEALREALVNTLIHADFTGRVSVLVVKRPDMFGFRNPGLMRVPPELAVIGGNSDCRNRRLQTMFQLVGYGDHAGSGLPKIYRNWAGQHWRRPALHSLLEPEQTLIELRMQSLVPEDVLVNLQGRLGGRFLALPELSRLALITASAEGMVNHARMREISTEHPADITKMLASLVRDRLLAADGIGRGMVYFLPWQKQPAGDLFDQAAATDEASSSITIPPELSAQPPELSPQPPEPGMPLYLDWADVPAALQVALSELASPVSQHHRVAASLLQDTVRDLCTGQYLGRRVLAHLLSRNPDDLLKRTLNPMVVLKQLRPAFASSSNPRQAYTSCISAATGIPIE